MEQNLPTATTLEGLQDFAYSNGLYLQTHTPETARHKGLYFPDYKIISLRDDLHPIEQRCTLAHELGHFIHGHLGCLPGKSERQARFWAANTLISLEEYQDAENINPAPAAIAYILQVTTETVADWQQLHQRMTA